mmetsp:Transcript_18432/g.52083  ORF Transcript_18432/g.52083 Transcript_18432/m.52083 type:complete len:233 (+) Transcript_18432:272-970(+)
MIEKAEAWLGSGWKRCPCSTLGGKRFGLHDVLGSHVPRLIHAADDQKLLLLDDVNAVLEASRSLPQGTYQWAMSTRGQAGGNSPDREQGLQGLAGGTTTGLVLLVGQKLVSRNTLGLVHRILQRLASRRAGGPACCILHGLVGPNAIGQERILGRLVSQNVVGLVHCILRLTWRTGQVHITHKATLAQATVNGLYIRAELLLLGQHLLQHLGLCRIYCTAELHACIHQLLHQ